MRGHAHDENAAAALSWKTSPRWYLWEGGFLLLGAAEGVVPPHAHHAIQVVMALDAEIAAKEESRDDWRTGRGLIVRPDTPHSFDSKGATGAMLFVDPESIEGIWLAASLCENVTVIPDARVEGCMAALGTLSERSERSAQSEPSARSDRSAQSEPSAQPLAAPKIGDAIRACVLSLCPGEPPARRRDARITKVLEAIRTSDELRMPLEDAAARAFLSPSRFAHLFTEQVGLPFRRYMLWRKLARAMVSIGRERTIAAAAQAADFADAAHLTRTFYQMFGMPPSALMRGEFFEIPSPFN